MDKLKEVASVLVPAVICLVLYWRMWRRETPEPMAWWKLVLPMVLGAVATYLSSHIVLMMLLKALEALADNPDVTNVTSTAPTNPWLRSFVMSLTVAGLPEELIKLAMLIVALKVIKPANVYEYGLVGAGVGIGFTVLEEYLYGSGGELVVFAIRLPGLLLHVAFNLIMGLFFGKARFSREQGRAGSLLYTILGVVLPLLWHTVFDMATANNPAISSGVESVVDDSIIFAIVVAICSVIGQIWVLVSFKKKASAYSEMTITQ